MSDYKTIEAMCDSFGDPKSTYQMRAAYAVARAAVLEAENAALKDQLGGKWLPIESAPKDGTRFMCYEKDAVWDAALAFAIPLKDGVCHVSLQIDGNDYSANPTHWQPLPPEPEG